MQRKGFGTVCQSVTRNKDISVEAKGIYSYLCSFCGKSDECYPSVSLMCEELHISKDRLYKHMQILIDLGIVTKVQTFNGNLKASVIYKVSHEVKSCFSVSENSGIREIGNPENKEAKNNIIKNNIIKNNREKKGLSSTALLNELILKYSFSEAVTNKLGDWISYKKERRENYKETGLKSLFSQVDKHVKAFGDVAVIDLIDVCMANGWRGIIWDRLQNSKTAEKEVKQDVESRSSVQLWN